MSDSTLPHQLAIASDHGGLTLKNAVVAHLKAGGYGVEDLGTHDGASVDYPDFAELVSERVLDGRADAGILVCTTGIGMSIAANRHAGIQASLVSDASTAAMTSFAASCPPPATRVQVSCDDCRSFICDGTSNISVYSYI